MRVGPAWAAVALLVLLASLVGVLAAVDGDEGLPLLSFPEGFVLGTSTAAYQIEGAWNESGKGESIWDRLTHANPGYVAELHNADVACDSYHKFEEDIQLVKSMGMSVYRFSLSWTRLLPSGGVDQPNPDGLRYYNALIDECLANGITPMVTLYHWDLPQALQDIGGWPNERVADFFADYAEYAFEHFGDRVKTWITFNEPHATCVGGYGEGWMAPALSSARRADYMCTHTLLKAHARAYRLYQDRFKAKQRGVVGISLNSNHFEPKDPKNPADVDAAETIYQFVLGWFAHPIFGSEGDYPALLKDRVAATSRAEGLKRSRLPSFTDEEVRLIRGSADFFGLNSYTSRLATPFDSTSLDDEGRSKDHMVSTHMDPSWNKTSAPWFRVVPWGFRKLLLWVRDHYDNPPVYVTENGFADEGEVHDVGRVRYYQSYLSELLGAIHEDHCNIKGYVAWSLLDNFEWSAGYTQKFGLIKVDFDDPERPRTPKLSSRYWSLVTALRRLPTEKEQARLLQDAKNTHEEF